MFEHLISYDKILVTGPQRSGTRIAAKMISHDTGHAFVDEQDFGVRNEYAFQVILKDRNKISVHCPTMCHCIHEHADDSTLVMLMIRDLDDIEASEKRIEWESGPYHELRNYGFTDKKAVSFRRSGGQVAAVKYAYWLTYQRQLIPHWLEQEYEALSVHSLWVSKEQRVNFMPKQTGL